MDQYVCVTLCVHQLTYTLYCTSSLGYLPHLTVHGQSTGHSTSFSTQTSVRTCMSTYYTMQYARTCTVHVHVPVHVHVHVSCLYYQLDRVRARVGCTTLTFLSCTIRTVHTYNTYDTKQPCVCQVLRRLNRSTTINCVLAYLIGDIICAAVA